MGKAYSRGLTIMPTDIDVGGAAGCSGLPSRESFRSMAIVLIRQPD